jgi:hypothetical protein
LIPVETPGLAWQYFSTIFWPVLLLASSGFSICDLYFSIPGFNKGSNSLALSITDLVEDSRFFRLVFIPSIALFLSASLLENTLSNNSLQNVENLCPSEGSSLFNAFFYLALDE